MRFAFKTASQYSSWEEILAVWREADGIEVFESGWLFDHLHPIVSPQREADPAAPCLEAWTLLAALSQATARLRLGTLVTGIHHRHPALLAKMAVTADAVSGGRLELGIGTGWNEAESAAYGLPLGGPGERSDRFEEACAVLVSLLSEQLTDFDGAHYQLRAAPCEPKGRQSPHPPITIGGAGERRTLRAVARHAQRWDASSVSTAEEMERKLGALAAHCEAIGRDPGEIEVSSQVWFDPAGESPTAFAATAAELSERGVDLVIAYLAPPLEPAVLAPLADALTALRG